MNKKGIFRKISAVFIVSLMLLMTSITAFAADISDSNYNYLSPIPLLIIKISYDANGNGRNDFDAQNPSKLTDKNSEFYGEQWSYSDDTVWYKNFFDTGNSASMINFYKKMTNDKFWYYPAEETSADVQKNGKENDGIVNVIVKHKHPEAKTNSDSSEDAASRQAALREADKYVNFASFDKNKDGKISYNELAIAFVCAGYESSGTSKTSKLAFGVHAHYTNGSGINADGVSVGNSGFVRLGEYVTSDTPATIGVLAHELGHFIGAADLYDTSSGGSYSKYVGNMSLMASGSWGGSKGAGPSYMDPYNAIVCGIARSSLIVDDGEYTLYSRQSKKGDYNILKITTQNPNEYYLIENRYSDSDVFDKSLTDAQKGIVIWHVDESIAASFGNKLNSSGGMHDPSVAVIGTSSLSTTAFKYIDNSINGQSYTFVPYSTKYKFPISGGPFTLLTDEQAKAFTIQVDVLSYAGNEMKIKVNSVITIPPAISVVASEKEVDSLTFTCRLTDLNGAVAGKAKLILSEDPNPTEENGTTIDFEFDTETYEFVYKFDELKANTKYFCKLIVDSDHGSTEKTLIGYTKAVQKPRTEYYVIYCYKGLLEVERSYEVRVKPGATFDYSFPMQKRGYDFCGWYLDSDYTERYDMAYTQDTCTDFSIYAKWVKSGNTATLKLVGATSKYKMFAAEVGDTFVEPVANEREGYSFGGWYADEELTVEFDFGEQIKEAEEVTIYAKWIKDSSQPEKTTETTTTVETTETTTTDKPQETSATETTDATQQPGEKTGCGAVIGVGAVVSAVTVVLACAIVTRKKED
ncbi:MAG: M6 family metalloprotease domain-containing protein [Clostridia bacterium]|nr:M6 family metalloprotease domain-containing protein [Clostridia bacterium]